MCPPVSISMQAQEVPENDSRIPLAPANQNMPLPHVTQAAGIGQIKHDQTCNPWFCHVPAGFEHKTNFAAQMVSMVSMKNARGQELREQLLDAH